MSFREAMQVQHSRMEWDVLEILNGWGYFPQMDKSFCLLQTTPDYWFAEPYDKAVYIDHVKVHFKRQDQDDELRSLLPKRYPYIKGVRGFPYERRSKKTALEVARGIRDWLEG